MIDERTKNSLIDKPSNCLSIRLSLVLSSIIVQKLCVPAHLWAGDSCDLVQQHDMNHKLADDDGALPLNNKASYMIKLILVYQS